MAESKRQFCLHLRTKTAYFRTPDGERMFDPKARPRATPALKRSVHSAPMRCPLTPIPAPLPPIAIASRRMCSQRSRRK